ncbi:MAG TPA: VWA domain-containing protein [Blastocatellia bacterium]|nr:VWA domain-containing protein [Blastocatellia bacterium]
MNPKKYRVVLAVVVAAASFLPCVRTTVRAEGSLTGQKQDPKQDKPKLQRSDKPKPEEEPVDDQSVIHLGRDLVNLDVTVVDQANKPVMDLVEGNFSVTEDKVPQKIVFFSKEQVPVSLVFTIDTSGSMRPKLDTVIKASVNLVKASKQGDELAVIEFKDQPELLEEFTSDTADVIDTLQGLVASRQTAMLDALYLAADYASKEGKNRRKAVILVTDGLDKDSYYKFSEVVDHLRETDALIYLIGFTGDLDKESGLFKKSEKGKAEALLTKLAEETGGKAFYPKELAEVHTIADAISTDLRTQYSIGYYPTNSNKDGTYRAIRVQVTAGNRRLVARNRNGRTAPRGDGSVSKPKPD